MTDITIPMDMYESPREIVMLIPLGWVEKKSVEVYVDDFHLIIKWIRDKPLLKEDLIMQQDECYRWVFSQKIQLPPYVYFDRIHSEITPENILIITVPKSIHPWAKMKVDVAIHQSTALWSWGKKEGKLGMPSPRGRPKKTV